MVRFLAIFNVCLTFVCAGVTCFFIWKTQVLQHDNDDLADDKVALLIDRDRISETVLALEDEVERLREEKEALGRNLVRAMNACSRLKEEAARTNSVLAAAAIERAAQAKFAREWAAREKAAREKAAADAAAKAVAAEKAKVAEKAKTAAAPKTKAVVAEKTKVMPHPHVLKGKAVALKVEDLKPLDQRAPQKSDRESLEELLELTKSK